MSHTVVRGEPTAAQLYLDLILDEILLAKGKESKETERDKVTLAEIMFHCLKRQPRALYMINGATGEKFTNEYILKLAVSIARSLSAKCPKGRTVMLMMRNHERMAATYWATLFSGVLPFMMDPNVPVYELSYFLELIEPHHVFCDREHYEAINKAVRKAKVEPIAVISDEEDAMRKFTEGFSDDFENFQLDASPAEASVMLLSTSGSTGFPKTVHITNKGLVAQLPSPWAHHSQFPTPTDMVMVLSNIQWMTFTMMVTSSVLYHIPLLISPKKPTVEHVSEMLEKYRPSWTFLTPAFAKGLLSSIRPDQLSSLSTVFLLGARTTPDLMRTFKEMLPESAQLRDSYGSTETQGLIAIPDGETPTNSNGKVHNILHYKVLDDNGAEVIPGNNGELYLKGECLITKYYKNVNSYVEWFSDGWYRTGDWVHLDKNERLYFIERRTFGFKFRGNQVAPEEIEAVISTVPGVLENVVCASEGGPAAAVVLQPTSTVTRDQIHNAVNSTLCEHKRLHGGIATVQSLPRTYNGKLRRVQCEELIRQLIVEGQCF